ncbi:MAG: DEAD/DEAH box helicase family protein [Clostridiales bacterium]|nr:DEAD/DEAH box helicase family protein [Clostridiales bacterium]
MPAAQHTSKGEQGKKDQSGFRVSVRELVEFSYFPQDLLPTTGLEEMWAGTRAHQARQSQQNGEVERPIKRQYCCLGEQLTVYGRMDAFTPGDIPMIEEIKLARPGTVPEAASSAHRAQALCYAAMVAGEEYVPQVRFCVSYVEETGRVLASFEETWEAEALFAELDLMLKPYMTFAISEKSHRERRDISVEALAFPFPRYRKGQRELAAQVYTAIARRKRLIASLPTGTGKSAAVLFPALKALARGKTGKILFLTARTTARQSPLAALEMMRSQGLQARVMTLSAREKLCPGFTRCHPDDCPRAKGHFLRQRGAMEELLSCGKIWTDECIQDTAERHQVCPFELALALIQLADVALMDINYAFDPFAQIKRLFRERKDMTLLVDEAHHLVDRVRESLSGMLDSRMLRDCRAEFGRRIGRKHPYYRALGSAIKTLRALEPDMGDNEGTLQSVPPDLVQAVEALSMAGYQLMADSVSDTQVMGDASQLLRLCASFLYAAGQLDEDYAILLIRHGKERILELCCLLPAREIARVTKGMGGTVFFSATMAPLPATKRLLGGGEEDACFSLPSPFPPDNLAVVRCRINTRYLAREETAGRVAEYIAQMVKLRLGKYIAYFPSYAYLRMIRHHLEEMDLPPLIVQSQEMDEAARQAFLEAFTMDSQPKLGLCVLGGLFSEGIDLPGEQLIGAMIVGVGLPVPSSRLRAIQDCYHRHFGDGFGYAFRIPGIQKVVQAAGRVIRTQEDRGVILLLDERYYQPEYAQLLPEHWNLYNENIAAAGHILAGQS